MNHRFDDIRSHAVMRVEQLRACYAQRFAGDLQGEWRAWLHVASRREAALGGVQRDVQRKPVWAAMPPAAKAVAREALLLIVKSQGLHLAFVEDLLTGARFAERTFTADLMIWIAAQEDSLLSPIEQQVAIERSGAALFSICAVLEAIVRQAYAQLETLARVLEGRPDGGKLGGLDRQFHVYAVEEAFHEQVFHELASWASRAGLEPKPTRRVCAERLASLLPNGSGLTGVGAAPIATDGGLASLFVRHRVWLASVYAPPIGPFTRSA